MTLTRRTKNKNKLDPEQKTDFLIMGFGCTLNTGEYETKSVPIGNKLIKFPNG